ncbi:MAG: GNAT family N-acetyltransferase, partial [Marinicella sp.]
MTYQIRSLQTADLEQVFKVRTATKENAITMEKLHAYGITVESLTQAVDQELQGWVCTLDQQIVGFSIGNKNTAEMQVLAVLPEHEGHGIAKQLMTAVETWLFKQGHDSIWLLTTPDPKLRAYG